MTRSRKKSTEPCARCGQVKTAACWAPIAPSGAKARKLCRAPLCATCDGQECEQHATQPLLLAVGTGETPQSNRRPLDRYYTPPWMVQALVTAYPGLGGDVLLDLTCGDGRMAELLASRFNEIVLNDIDPNAKAAHTHYDGLSLEYWQMIRAKYKGRRITVVTNPPFDIAGELVKLMLEHCEDVFVLVRCTFGEPCSKTPRNPHNSRRWLPDAEPTGLVMLSRDSYSGDGKSDSAPTWWFVWCQEFKKIRVISKDRIIGQENLIDKGQGIIAKGQCK